MNLRQEVGGVKLKWRKLNSTADIKTIPFKDFSEVIVFIESNKDAEKILDIMPQASLISAERKIIQPIVAAANVSNAPITEVMALFGSFIFEMNRE